MIIIAITGNNEGNLRPHDSGRAEVSVHYLSLESGASLSVYLSFSVSLSLSSPEKPTIMNQF